MSLKDRLKIVNKIGLYNLIMGIFFIICNCVIISLGIVCGTYLIIKNHIILGTIITIISLLLFSGIKIDGMSYKDGGESDE